MYNPCVSLVGVRHPLLKLNEHWRVERMPMLKKNTKYTSIFSCIYTHEHCGSVRDLESMCITLLRQRFLSICTYVLAQHTSNSSRQSAITWKPVHMHVWLMEGCLSAFGIQTGKIRRCAATWHFRYVCFMRADMHCTVFAHKKGYRS